MNKNIIPYSIILLLIIPLFGINGVMSLLGNLLILAFVLPIFIVLIGFIGINSFSSKLKKCDKCGTSIIGNQEECLFCGANLNEDQNQFINEASKTTIEIDAEEIK